MRRYKSASTANGQQPMSDKQQERLSAGYSDAQLSTSSMQQGPPYRSFSAYPQRREESITDSYQYGGNNTSANDQNG